VLDPAQEVLFRRDADATANDETERRQHKPVAPRMQGTDEGPSEACDDECHDAAE
jgi:hypothetical protein